MPVQRLVADARYELIPLSNVDAQVAHVPEGSSISVTCSPAKGLQPTLDLTARLLDQGRLAVPHLSARLVADRASVSGLARWCRAHRVDEVFVIAGDAPQPVGAYDGVVAFLRDLLELDHGLRRVGVAAYPDGHPLIDAAVVHDALHAKQHLLSGAGVAGYASTQMCFDVRRWRTWARTERAAGLSLPLHLGVPGAVDRSKLVTIGARLGVGSSLRFLRKNRAVLGRLVAPGGYDPTGLISDLGADAADLGIEGVHLFTFNSVESTAAWQRDALRGDALGEGVSEAGGAGSSTRSWPG